MVFSALLLPALATAQMLPAESAAPPSLLGDRPAAGDNYGTQTGLAWIPATRFRTPINPAAPGPTS